MDQDQEEYSKEDAARRRDEALRRALNTPRKPHTPIGKRKRLAKQETREERDSMNFFGGFWAQNRCGDNAPHLVIS